MEKKQKKNNKITKTDWVFGLGMAMFMFLTFIGIKFSYDLLISVVLTFIYVGIAIISVFGLKKIKTVENKFNTWKIVESIFLIIYIIIIVLFINQPMGKTFKAYSERNNLREQAHKELDNIEQTLKQYKTKEEEAINRTITTISNAKGYSTNAYYFDEKSKKYINFFVVGDEEGGKITDSNIDEYEKLLKEIFIIDRNDYINNQNKIIKSMKQKEWNIFNLYDIWDYSIFLDKLYKKVENDLTEFSKVHQPAKGYPYKFVIKNDKGVYKVDSNEQMEFEYEINNDKIKNNQSDFMTKVYQIKNNRQFSIFSIIVSIMILFPYLMANRSSKVEIKRMYDKNKYNIGGRQLK